MTVILVLATFLVFIVVDYALNRRKVLATVPVETASANPAVPASSGGDFVDGFLVPGNISYHPGHSWLVRERKNVVRVGADEFAAALLGKFEKIELPKPGQWIRQGQKVVSLLPRRRKDRNGFAHRRRSHRSQPRSVAKPGSSAQRPLRQGLAALPSTSPTRRTPPAIWSPRAWSASGCAMPWSACMPCNRALAGAVAADGGRPSEDLLAGLPDANWKEVTAEFFLTA